MLHTEYVKNLHCNYEKVLLEKKPEERRYQYCILTRGGIKGLLPCSLRYLNGQAYLYYDITSKQSVKQLFLNRKVTREWVRDFMWSFQQIRTELERFLLEEHNIVWYPAQIFQDLEQKVFSFLYMPYYEGENGFHEFLEFLVEHVDYEDDELVECIYKMYEQFDHNGDIYLQEQILEDVKILEQERNMNRSMDKGIERRSEKEAEGALAQEAERTSGREAESGYDRIVQEEYSAKYRADEDTVPSGQAVYAEQTENMDRDKRGFFAIFNGKKRKNKEQRNSYRQSIRLSMEGHAVAEDTSYEEEDYGKTVYIADVKEKKDIVHRLYTPTGKILAQLDRDCLTIGKKKEDADLVLDDLSISRVHARITREGEAYYLEDMNSTNGTAKNGLRLQPYEKRKLEEEDEIRLGEIEIIFR